MKKKGLREQVKSGEVSLDAAFEQLRIWRRDNGWASPSLEKWLKNRRKKV